MKINGISLLMAVLWSDVLIGGIYWVRKKRSFNIQFGLKCIVMLYVWSGIRMLFPVDFAFTIGVPVRGCFSQIYDVLNTKRSCVGNIPISILDCAVTVWGITAMILLLGFAVRYKEMIIEVDRYDKREDMQCLGILRKIAETTEKKIMVSVYKSDDITAPLGVGIWKKRILLPEKDYTDTELYYICMHEYTHFLNKDLVVKILVHIYCCIFWWNPVVYLLQKDLEQVLEIKCDLSVTGILSNIEAADYLETIVSTLRNMENKKKNYVKNSVVTLTDDSESEMVERFRMVLECRSHSQQKNNLWMAIFGILLIASYSVFPMTSYEAPVQDIVVDNDTYEITHDNSYILQEGGKYYWIVEINGYRDIEEVSEEQVRGLVEEDGFELREELKNEK